MVRGSVLNFPSGTSKVGDIRCDIDPDMQPDIIASLYHPPFRERSFDTVICDPPFAMFTQGPNRFRWALDLAKIARRRCMVSTPKISLNLGREAWTKRWYVNERGSIQIRLWQVFDRKHP
jgi:hypothetical protein